MRVLTKSNAQMKQNYFPLFFAAVMLLSVPLFAQQNESPCGTGIPEPEWENQFSALVRNYKNASANNAVPATNSYTIPVIFHIIHGGEAPGTYPNLSQGQILSQMTVLNDDFAGIGMNSNTYPALAFAGWASAQGLPAANLDSSGRVKIADSFIRFCLAEKDTLGNLLAEPGIDRIDYIAHGWADPASFTNTTTMRAFIDGTVKPRTIWNVQHYLNIWISDRHSSIQFTGFATMPPLSTLAGIQSVGTDSTDGIWCYTRTVGSWAIYPSGIYASTSVSGRTITHEAGHYLGLRHIWGDGSCATDYCDDTPPAAAQNTGTPSYPLNAGSCNSPSNAPDGEMFMNFMDYPMDPSKYMFTTDQVIRMQTAMLNSPFRNQLGLQGLCSPAGFSGTAQDQMPIVVSPNPFINSVSVNCEKETLLVIRLYDAAGNLVRESTTNTLYTADLPAGFYFLRVLTRESAASARLIRAE